MDSDTTKIVSFMAFAALFALIGESEKNTTASKSATKNGSLGTSAKIIVGASLAAVLLSLLAEAGGTGAQFAIGLAGITLVGSIVVNGAEVFGGISKLTKGS